MPTSEARSLTRPLFTDQDFVATKFNTTADKAWFANALCRFVDSDFRQTLWTQRLYRRLSLCFQNIAHYNSAGFWQEFFDDLRGKVAFLETTLSCPCYGEPEYTYCDVERAIQARLHACGMLAIYRALHAAEIEGAERALLSKLREKYEGVPPTRAADLPIVRSSAPARSRRIERISEQPSLL